MIGTHAEALGYSRDILECPDIRASWRTVCASDRKKSRALARRPQRFHIRILTTLTTANDRPGCRVGERTYVEGEMVRDIEWKATCDNCFCAMGAIRCVPLACAPPLQGCSPIVREGQCCPSTYNCSEFTREQRESSHRRVG